jgi:hypothetical protein
MGSHVAVTGGLGDRCRVTTSSWNEHIQHNTEAPLNDFRQSVFLKSMKVQGEASAR